MMYKRILKWVLLDRSPTMRDHAELQEVIYPCLVRCTSGDMFRGGKAGNLRGVIFGLSCCD